MGNTVKPCPVNPSPVKPSPVMGNTVKPIPVKPSPVMANPAGLTPAGSATSSPPRCKKHCWPLLKQMPTPEPPECPRADPAGARTGKPVPVTGRRLGSANTFPPAIRHAAPRYAASPPTARTWTIRFPTIRADGPAPATSEAPAVPTTGSNSGPDGT